jgi:hypothetical protein
MCEASPGDRCASDTRGQCAHTRAVYQDVHPNGPAVNPVTSAEEAFAPSEALEPVRAPEGTYPVWVRAKDGTAVLEGAYATVGDQCEAFKRASDGGKNQATMGDPANAEDSDQVTAKFRRLEGFRVAGQERAGRGPVARRASDWVQYSPKIDAEVFDAAETLGVDGACSHMEGDPDNPGPWTEMGKVETLQPGDEVWSGQEFLSGTHMASLTKQMGRARSEYVSEGADEEPWTLPKLYRHSNGSVWILDGNHRICAARAKGRPIRVQTLDHRNLADVKSWLEPEEGDEPDDDDE